MPLSKVTPGALITATAWNEVIDEFDKKLDKTGGTMTGPLTVNAPVSSLPQLSLSGGNSDLAATQGDLRIGNASAQLRIGVDTSGVGLGESRIRALGGSSKLILGAGTSDVCVIDNNSVVTFHSPTGATLLAISGGDLILPARSNPDWHVVNANGIRGNGKWCRAFVNWKANANAPDELHINWGNDFAGGTHIGSGLHLANSDIYFSKTDHVHTGLGNPAGHAAIENSTAPYNTLMILGRMVNGRRKVSLWDDVTVHGDFFVPSLPFGDRGNAQFEASTGRFFYDNSSRSYKTNIQPWEDDFKKMLQLQPRTYTRDHSPEHTEIGYIAEELQSLGLNKLVYYDDKGQPDGLNYTKMCMYLLEILRDHEAKLNPKSPYLERYVEATDAPGKKSATKSNSKK